MFFRGKNDKKKNGVSPPPQGGKNNHPSPQGGKNDISPQGGNDNLPPGQSPPVPKPRRSLREAFAASLRGLRRLTLKDLRGAAGQTFRDLRKPREVGLLVVAIIVPGGMFGWGAYRLQKFKSRKPPANQNAPAADRQKPPPRKPGKNGPKPG
jgi:hypothetical protein